MNDGMKAEEEAYDNFLKRAKERMQEALHSAEDIDESRAQKMRDSLVSITEEIQTRGNSG